MARRREFLKGTGAAIVGGAFAQRALHTSQPSAQPPAPADPSRIAGDARPLRWNGAARNVVLVRYGGGVRREETTGAWGQSLSPFLHESLLPNGTLYDNLFIPWGISTGHMEGTLLLTTGRHETPVQKFPGRGDEFPFHPTVFETYRKASGAGPHDAVVVNNEQRNTEFVAYSSAPGYGRRWGGTVLSLHALAIREQRRALGGDIPERERREREAKLAELLTIDQRPDRDGYDDAEIEERFFIPFLQRFGYRPPKGDAFQTEATIQALRTLRPRLLMVHYQDCDYAHWGASHFYYEGVRRMDQGLRRIVEEIQENPSYRENTVLLVVPDVGRGINVAKNGGPNHLRLHFQHHNPEDKGSHETFALAWGSGIAPGKRIDEARDPVDVAPTVAALLGHAMPGVDGRLLDEVVS
ncbi:MAG: sulfatase-like hydrolase/transferase [Acidobacteriota bacterium]